MNSYEEFATIYDNLIHGDIDYHKWSNKILEICKRKGIELNDYLDVACGTGNLTIELSKYFKVTWGIDLSSDMLMEAETKFRDARKKAKFVCQDMTDINLNKQFDLITSALDSANYITEDEGLKDFFSGVYDHLKENGLFVFDMNSYYKLSNILGNNLYTHDSEDIVYIWENVFEDEIVSMYLTFFLKNGEEYKRFDECHTERAYKEKDVEEILKSVGFNIVEKLDNYNEKKVTEKTERITYIVRKN
ncbi:class I SAM-dependent DNA methyltransferase [Clostridium grantii]|uniref:Methyltransferase domain-containing protein n=1 Tax=Clostridium grantii DSM 8605 TaxID=1121316 RepID=A0A1M5Y0P5_9CLOT|nr:class I SAM-dependent methyltransferase [Clostridium grantii]SHI05635.1 Methyltransferase domain-containing protein [Clostridium grantii DSM 8605]